LKGNKLIFSKRKEERIKGYKKLIKNQEENYTPPKDIAKDIVEAMLAQDYKIDIERALCYLKASYAVFDRRFYLQNNE
jgi:hypothetical protein